jgi:hypothetical protein
MEFGLGYDKSLSIILTNDVRKRGIIVDFIKQFPKKLYLDLLNKLDNNLEDKYYEEFRVKDIIYFYLIDRKDGCLTIGSYMKKDSYNNSIFILKLYPYNELDDSLILGNVIYQYKEPDKKNINVCDRVKYSLEKNSSGMDFVRFYGYRLLFNKVTKRIMVDDSLSFDEIISLENKKEEKRCLTKKLFNNFCSKFQN